MIDRSEDAVADRQILASVFASRVALAKISERQAMRQASTEWWRVRRWVASNGRGEKSFLWFCDEFDLEPDAVRRAIYAATPKGAMPKPREKA